MVTRQTETLEGFDGKTLYGEKYLVDGAKAVVIMLHGYAEHCGRYQQVIQNFNQKGLSVYTFDARGHGKSPGDRAFVESYHDFLDDLDLLYARVRDRHKLPLFLFGHSMGGGVATRFVVTRRPKINGLVLSSPLLLLPDNTPKLLQKIAPIVAKLAPKLLVTPGPPPEELAVNQEVGRKFMADNLCYHGKVYARTGAELLLMTQDIRKELDEVRESFLVLTGDDDKIVDPKGSAMLADQALSFDKRHIRYPGLRHELLNEENWLSIADEITGWILERLDMPVEAERPV